MFEYDFVRIPVVGLVSKRLKDNYQTVIHEKAALGWRFVQLLPGGQYSELIFERPVAAPA